MDEPSPSDRLYLDDLHVGQRFISASHTLGEAQIKTFALQFDPQPFHADEQAAQHSGAGGEVTWPAPTRPGDTLHVESEVVEITPSRSRPDRGTIVLVSKTLNQRAEVVQVLKVRLVVARRVSP